MQSNNTDSEIPSCAYGLISLVCVLIIFSQSFPEGAFLFCPGLMAMLGCICWRKPKIRHALIYCEWWLGRSITIIIMGSVICQFAKYEKIKCGYCIVPNGKNWVLLKCVTFLSVAWSLQWGAATCNSVFRWFSRWTNMTRDFHISEPIMQKLPQF